MTCAELEEALHQQQAENEALRAQLAALQSLSASVPAFAPASLLDFMLGEPRLAVVLADAHCQVQWVNASFTELCGLAMSEVLGRKPETFLRPHLRDEAAIAHIKDSLQAGMAFQYEVTNPRPGSEGWLRVNVRPVPGASASDLVHYVGLLEDITEWKQDQLARAESEERFRNLTENVPGVLYEWRKHDKGGYEFGYVSPKVLELFGIQPAALAAMTDFIHPDDLEDFLLILDESTRNRLPWLYEGRIVVPGQPLRWLRGSAIVTGTGPDWVQYSGILLDITPLKQAEGAVRQSNLRWQLATDAFADGTWEVNLKTDTYYYSLQYQRLLGYSEQAFAAVRSRWQNLVHPDDHALLEQCMGAYLSGQVADCLCENRMRCADGSYKWVLTRAVVTERDAAGAPVILSGAHTDISTLKHTQQALEVTTHSLYTAINHFREGMVLEDENRRVMLTNDAFAREMSRVSSASELVGLDGEDLARESCHYMRYPSAYLARIAAVLARRELVTGDLVEMKDGRVLQRDYIPVKDADGRYLGQLWKFRDITVRTRAEEELKRREEKYRGIIENMSLGLVEADLDDHLIYANQSFCDMTGFCTSELQGQRLSPLLLSGEDLALVESKLVSRQDGIADSYEIVVTTKEGEKKWLLVSGAPLYDNQHQHVGSIGIYLDVTPQKQLEASLREAKAAAEISTRAKQDFLVNMSHEIRTPMNAILGMSHLLAQTALDETQANYLHAITASADTLLVIINDILDLSKIEAGYLAVERIGFSIAQVYAQVEKTLRYKAEEKGLLLETWLAPDLPAVLVGDPYRLTQILLNLAGNAVKFTEQGYVRIAATLLGRPTPHEVEVAFMVEDTGVGIEASYLQRVFDEFSQEDSSITRQFGGTGLGLSISKKLVALLGGELRLASRKHEGTTSSFTLRLAVGNPQLVLQKEAAQCLYEALQGKRLLLVEDNVFNRMLATTFLANAGIEVHEAANGKVAVELARQHTFDLVLMDVQMPVQNGYEATAQLRQELQLTVPIVALTANAIVGERAKCLAAGMNDYLTKPFQEIALLKMVYKWVIGPPPTTAPAAEN
jgi:PAS domain S-box-containing protein